MRKYIFLTAMIACLIYAWRRGGWPEQASAVVVLVGALLTRLSLSSLAGRYGTIELGPFVVDLAVFAAFLAIAYYSDRGWPTWTAGLQLAGTLAHLARLIDPEMPRNGYTFIMAFWGYPILLTIVIGTWRHSTRNSNASPSSPAS